MDTTATRLLLPTPTLLPGFIAALERGWSPDTTRGPLAALELLDKLHDDPASFFVTAHDPEAKGPPVTLPDGTQRPRLPGLTRWIWDAADAGPAGFVGSINLRWMPGHAPLPSHVLGHCGYGVVPWQRQRGHATRALGLMLGVAREQGLPFVELTTDEDNAPSQRVITAQGGVLLGPFQKDAAFGGKTALRYRIALG